ncbi:transposase [Bacillus cereus group sp. N6]|nr:transposase [Bacillus cereus group sp. N6]
MMQSSAYIFQLCSCCGVRHDRDSNTSINLMDKAIRLSSLLNAVKVK